MNCFRCRMLLSGLGFLLWVGGCGLAVAAELSPQSGFRQEADWSVKSAEAVGAELFEWIDASGVPARTRAELEAVWEQQLASQVPPMEASATVAAMLHDDVHQLLATIRTPRQSLSVDPQPALTAEDLPEWMRQNLQLLYGRWLASHDYLEEARDCLASLSPYSVADPPMLFFYRGLLAYRLLDKKTCMDQLQPLIDHSELVPRRYVSLAQLMVADIRPVQTDTLDEVARIMDRIRLRLGLGRAGTRVRGEEDDVVAKLDKMIEELEKRLEAAQQQQSSGGSAGGNSPSSPMQDSVAGGATGPGNVDRKNLGQPTDWGNLPPREREEALQQLGEDVPSHYRSVIEEYFRTLARDGSNQDGT